MFSINEVAFLLVLVDVRKLMSETSVRPKSISETQYREMGRIKARSHPGLTATSHGPCTLCRQYLLVLSGLLQREPFTV